MKFKNIITELVLRGKIKKKLKKKLMEQYHHGMWDDHDTIGVKIKRMRIENS